MFDPGIWWCSLHVGVGERAMGHILRGSATTTEAVLRAFQHGQASLKALAKRYGINPKTMAKWRQRASVADQRIGPEDPRSTVLSREAEAVVVTFRRHTLLPLDDCLHALQATIPYLTRSSLHRCLLRGHLQGIVRRTLPLQFKPAPPNARTKHALIMVAQAVMTRRSSPANP